MQVTVERMLVIIGKQTVELAETREQASLAAADAREAREQLAAAQAANMSLVDRVRALSQPVCNRGETGESDVDADIARVAMDT